ncbi:MAG: 4-hydroxy-4-methyl-2-oxoglutarate aldolase [Alphaproteobacteria bacterium]|nr:4-hydroxy-4-methyl-2-oxoglutarate aldolase [Alphaproteobacteria bacterium]
MPEGRKLTIEQIAMAVTLPSSTIHEAAGRIGALPAAIKPVAQGMTVCGPAFPVKGPPLDNLALHFGIDEAQPGDVIVADVSGHYEGGYFGEVMCTSARARKLGGLVINGCVRDGNELAQMGWPVFSRGFAMRGTLKDPNGDLCINERIAIGEVIIEPGDLVVGDTDGVVVIPKAAAPKVIEASIKREANEVETMELLAKGETTLVKMRGWERR